MKIINKIKFWYWWTFKATSMEKASWDLYVRGVAIRKMTNQCLDNAYRVSPSKFFIDPKKSGKNKTKAND